MTTRLLAILLAFFSAEREAAAALLHAIPPPFGSPQLGASMGRSVAVDGDVAVTGAPSDDFGERDAGVVKVFNIRTGALLHVLPNPSPSNHGFGTAVAISGSRILVGMPNSIEGGKVWVYDLSQPTPTAPILTLVNPTPSVVDTFGVALAISGSRVVVGDPADDVGASNAGAAYAYDLDGIAPATPVAVLKKPVPAAGDGFGHSVGLSGTKIVVGSPNDDREAPNAGAAYVFDLAGSSPTQPVAILKMAQPVAGDSFGFSVGIDGDVVAVGAPNDDTDDFDAGGAAVFDLSGQTPALPFARLTNPTPQTTGQFGWSVAISAGRIAVGRPGDGSTNPDARVYVYDVQNLSVSTPVLVLSHPPVIFNDDFGIAVAISATHALVGAPRHDLGGDAYGYELDGAMAGNAVRMLNEPGPAAFESFGASVAISGSLMVVGAPFVGSGYSQDGAAYVYDLEGATPSQPIATLLNPHPDGYGFFGSSVAISGTKIVVGANGDSAEATYAGRAYVYDLAGGTPGSPIATLLNPSPGTDDNFGISVAISGSRIVVGASGDDAGASQSGSAYVYNLAGANPTAPVVILNNPSPAVFDTFGSAVAISGPLVIVGAPNDDTGKQDAGSAYVYNLDGQNPQIPAFTLNLPSPGPNTGSFGTAVALSGQRALVGGSEHVYVYDLGGSSPTVPTFILDSPEAGTTDYFGWSVALSGHSALVGAYWGKGGADLAGTAYLYDLGGATPLLPAATILNPTPANGDKFGFAVAIDGTTIAVGAPYDDTVMPDKGHLYVFDTENGGGVDDDADGLPDSWERTHFGNILAYDGQDDPDGDGHDNADEFAALTDPMSPASFFRCWAEMGGGNLVLKFQTMPGRTYRIEWSDRLETGLWTAAGLHPPLSLDGTGTVLQFTVPAGITASRFYRIAVSP